MVKKIAANQFISTFIDKNRTFQENAHSNQEVERNTRTIRIFIAEECKVTAL